VVAPENGGAFAFHDLPHGWSGRLLAMEHPLSGAVVFEVEAPRTDLVLELARGPAVTGRIRTAHGRADGRLAGVAQLWIVADEESYLSTDALFGCRDDGTFRIGCAIHPELVHAKLVLAIEDEQAGDQVHETPPFVAANGLDLGELVLEPLRPLTVTVRDTFGAPLEGALARVDGPSFRRRAPLTGPDGRGTLALVPDREVDVRFSALGHADRIVRVWPGDEPDVALEPLTLLEVRFLGSLAADARRIRIAADADPFPAWRERVEEAVTQRELGGVRLAAQHPPMDGGERHVVELDVRPGGPVHVVGAAPGIVLSVAALDARGRVLDSGRLALAPAERATLVLGREDGGGPPPKQTSSGLVEEQSSR
jgi:hypothetical protein